MIEPEFHVDISFHKVGNCFIKSTRWKWIYLMRFIDGFAMLFFIFVMTVLSDMFNKKVKVTVGVTSARMITCTLFTVFNTKLF